MPRTSFASLPDDARVWVFGAAQPVTSAQAQQLLRAVDDYLDGWQAHGLPLTSAREWREDRFLVVGVDQASAGASGCSIDALFRVLQQLQSTAGTSLVGGGLVFFRAPGGAVTAVARSEFGVQRARGDLADATPVFDTTVTSAGEYRSRFEGPLAGSWHAAL